MIRRTLIVSLALCWLAGCGDRPTALPKVREHPDAAGPEVVLEAEAAASIEPPVEVMEDKEASGGKCLLVKGGSGKPGEKIPGEGEKKYPSRWGAAVYTFTVKEPGEYRIWGRKWWENACGNSFTFVVNGVAVTFGEDGTYDAWEWLAAPRLFALKAGENRLEVLNREDGVRLDKILVTRDTEYVPQGKE